MTASTRRCIRHLAGASCAAALLTAAVGVAGAQAAPQPTTAAAQSSSAAPYGPCTGNHIEGGSLVWDPPGCTPP
ncbi:hypothetical protein ACIGO6_31650 [Streptomyces sp. NPDC053750]|uniref:hypothetical protein n=1 Tax=Streptomyces sp. NPDC053750 TaxID=3365714 RepID=UPI0037D6EEAD